MAIPFLLKELAEERIVLLDKAKLSKISFLLGGLVRLIDKGGHTLGIVLSEEKLEEIKEEFEATSPDFLASLEASRHSGHPVSSAEVKRKAGIK